ncbi:AraC-like DNA-binding protein [Chryseobacterium geocarposphaerae]|uniref:AraC-like DNA-binding protein n=2 Tax=Chryseobacterium geocarposphaerae TaxID=1416776 RepID=A0A2M9C708_9FLAO|nr:AraC-like DNA-binding protein [Chryseobacterium geocarposphaerae]
MVWAQNTPAEVAIKDKLDKFSLTSNIDPKQKEARLLELKAESEKLGYDLGILISGNYLIKLYGRQYRYKEQLRLGDQLKKVAKNKKDTYGYISGIYQSTSLALGYLGLNDASLKDLKKAISYAETIEDRDTRLYQLSVCYENMALNYELKRGGDINLLRDSLLYTYKKSLEMAKQVSDNSEAIRKNVKYDHIAYTYMRLGMLYLEPEDTKENLESAEKYLLEGLKIHESKKYEIPADNRIMMLNQVSWLYLEKKEYHKSIDYAERALKLENVNKNPAHRVESFEFLADSYREIGDKEKSGFYMDKYTYLKDSLSLAEKKEADITMKKMVKEVNDENKQSSKKQWMITGILALIAGLITAILWRKKNKALRKKYEEMLVNLKNEKKDQVEETSEETDLDNTGEESNDDLQSVIDKNILSPDTEAKIQKKLTAFEKSEKYLKKDLTISSLAVQLNTNTKYLSEVIKNKKFQNFNHYINSLRINYIVHKLYNEPKYREYKISYLAEECGFASPQVFVIAFKKINGLPPSYFIQNLKEDKVNILISEDSLL